MYIYTPMCEAVWLPRLPHIFVAGQPVWFRDCIFQTRISHKHFFRTISSIHAGSRAIMAWQDCRNVLAACQFSTTKAPKMTKSKYDMFRDSLARHGVAPHTSAAILHECFGVASAPRRRMAQSDAAFDLIQQEVRDHRRTVLGNKSKWRPELVHLYEHYISILDGIIADVDACRAVMVRNPEDPNGPKIPATLADITRISAKKNRQLCGDDFDPDSERDIHVFMEPPRTSVWTSWVSPIVVDHIATAFVDAYAACGAGKGQRFRPFVTVETRRRRARQIAIHRTFIDNQRESIFKASPPDERGRVASLYGALHLTALRQAERMLDSIEKPDYRSTYARATRGHPVLDAVPVNWRHLLTPEMRKRLKAADEDPSSITPNGLDSYYLHMPPDDTDAWSIVDTVLNA